MPTDQSSSDSSSDSSGLTWDPFTPVPAGESAADALVRLLVLDYSRWRPEDLDDARAVLAADPALAGASIHTAAATGDAAAVRRLLAADPALAGQRGGPHGWPPLLYACYSRLPPGDGRSTLAAARALLAGGADPGAGFRWAGNLPPFTALTGAFGEGEDGNNHPPHPERDALARALLDAGADANDGQTLYNRHFRADDGHLRLLFEYGLADPAMLTEEMWCAARKDFGARVELLIAHGVPVDQPGRRDGRTPYQGAMAFGNLALAERLVAAGAAAPPRSPAEQLATACLAGRGDEARTLLAAHPGLRDALGRSGRAALLHRAVEARHADGIRLMAELGFELDDAGPGPDAVADTALHQAAWAGDVELVRVLLELGARVDVRDPSYGSRPVAWAHHNHQPATVALLLPSADIFDAVRCDGPDRVAALLAADPALARATDDDGDAVGFYLHRGLRHLDELIALLARHGADFRALHHSGDTLLAYMQRTRNDRVAAALGQWYPAGD